MSLPTAFVVAIVASVACASVLKSDSPALTVSVSSDGTYNISVDGTTWLSSSSEFTVCISGAQVALNVVSVLPTSGSDKFGPWAGTVVSLGSVSPLVNVSYAFKSYVDSPSIAVLTASFPSGVNTAGCGDNTAVSTYFPSFDTGAASAPSLSWVSWKGSTLPVVAGRGLQSVNTNALDIGPIVLLDNSPQSHTLTLSTLVSVCINAQIRPLNIRDRCFRACHQCCRIRTKQSSKITMPLLSLVQSPACGQRVATIKSLVYRPYALKTKLRPEIM